MTCITLIQIVLTTGNAIKKQFPKKEPKDGKKLTDKEIKALTIQALTDLGYIK